MDGDGNLGGSRDDFGGEAPVAFDAGTIVPGASAITFTSGIGSYVCDTGQLMVWSDVVVDKSGLRATVTRDDCGRGLDPDLTVRYLGIDTP
jgi:hypothetical protein